jgi:hypothetical protein
LLYYQMNARRVRLCSIAGSPPEWKGVSGDEQHEIALDRIRQPIFSRLSQLTRRRLKDEPIAEWRTAFDDSGPGYGMRRSIVMDRINEVRFLAGARR